MVAIDIERVVKRYAATGVPAVGGADGAGVSLRIESGELFFLLGPSGCGKTTLLRMIAGLAEPTAGRIVFDRQDMTRVPAHQRDTAMVFQGYALWPHMTVAGNIAFGLDVRKLKEPERSRRIAEALELVQMGEYRDRKPAQLSGGQQQRVALARALAIRPRCLLFDEPLSNLDAKIRMQMRAEIRRIVKEAPAGGGRGGITSIYVTHDQKEALSMADRIGVMEKGQLAQVGTPGEMYRHPATEFVAGFIGESNFIRGRVEAVEGDIAAVQTGAGVLRAVGGAQIGADVTVAIRPEAVRVVADGTPHEGVNRLRGRPVSSVYLGETAEHVVELAGGQRVRAMELNPRGETDGGDVWIEIDIAQALIVRG